MERQKRILAAVEHYVDGKLQETRYIPDVIGKKMEWQVSLDEVASLVRDHGYEFTNYSQEKIRNFEREEGIVFLIRGLEKRELIDLAKASSTKRNV